MCIYIYTYIYIHKWNLRYVRYTITLNKKSCLWRLKEIPHESHFNYIYLCVYICVCVLFMCVPWWTCGGQRTTCRHLLPPCRSWRLNSGWQACQQAPLPAVPSWRLVTSHFRVFCVKGCSRESISMPRSWGCGGGIFWHRGHVAWMWSHRPNLSLQTTATWKRSGATIPPHGNFLWVSPDFRSQELALGCLPTLTWHQGTASMGLTQKPSPILPWKYGLQSRVLVSPGSLLGMQRQKHHIDTQGEPVMHSPPGVRASLPQVICGSAKFPQGDLCCGCLCFQVRLEMRRSQAGLRHMSSAQLLCTCLLISPLAREWELLGLNWLFLRHRPTLPFQKEDTTWIIILFPAEY